MGCGGILGEIIDCCLEVIMIIIVVGFGLAIIVLEETRMDIVGIKTKIVYSN